jgi:hypothetical protein
MVQARIPCTVTFDCGDEPLNNYPRRQVSNNHEKGSIGVTYGAVDEGALRAVPGCVTLAMASVTHNSFRGIWPRLVRVAVDSVGTARRGSALRRRRLALISEAFRISLPVGR